MCGEGESLYRELNGELSRSGVVFQIFWAIIKID